MRWFSVAWTADSRSMELPSASQMQVRGPPPPPPPHSRSNEDGIQHAACAHLMCCPDFLSNTPHLDLDVSSPRRCCP